MGRVEMATPVRSLTLLSRSAVLIRDALGLRPQSPLVAGDDVARDHGALELDIGQGLVREGVHDAAAVAEPAIVPTRPAPARSR